MISTVARAKVTGINRFVFRIVRRERTESDRSDQFLLHKIDNGIPVFLIENGIIERDCENLVWSERGIVRAGLRVTIDDIVKISAVREPEAFVKRSARAFRMFLVALRSVGIVHLP